MFNIGSLLVILVIVILLFGTKRLKNIGSDLGGALRGFKNAINDGEKKEADKKANQENLEEKNGTVIEGEVIKEKDQTK